MPIAVYFHLTGLSVEQLAEVHRCAHDGIDGAAPGRATTTTRSLGLMATL